MEQDEPQYGWYIQRLHAKPLPPLDLRPIRHRLCRACDLAAVGECDAAGAGPCEEVRQSS